MQNNYSVTSLPRRAREWVLLFVVLASVGALLAYQHFSEAERTRATDRDRLHVLINVIASDMQGNLVNTRLALDGIIQDFLAPGYQGMPVDLTLRLKALDMALPGTYALFVLDESGIVSASSRTDLIGRNFSRSDFFLNARKAMNPATMYVSAPFQIDSGLLIAMGRIVRGADGEFAGMAVSVLGADYFADSFTPVIYAPDVWGLAIHGDGMLFMNYPSKPNIDGISLDNPQTLFSRHLRSGQGETIQAGTEFSTGENRLMSFRTVQTDALRMDKPIIVALGRRIDAIELPLRSQAIAYCAAYLCMAGLCCLALYWTQVRRAHYGAMAAALEQEKRDARERDQRDEAIRQSEARFRTLIEDAPLAIAILRKGHFIYTNPRYRHLHGYGAEDDLSGMPWSAMISPASRAALREQETLIQNDSPIEQTFEALGIGKGGRMVPVLKASAQVSLIDGPATLIFAQDISAQKQAEDALKQARDVAEAASSSKADFLANMSHEIRSPLNAILGLAYLLEQAHLSSDAHGMVRKIRASGRLLLGIINDILDVSKIEAGHMTIERAPFRLDEVVDNVSASMSVAAGDKDIQLIIQPPPAELRSVVGDALRLEQVLTNLTSNAIKFTEHGLVEVRIALQSRHFEEVKLRFAVRDTGIGIPKDKQQQIFSAFTQADSSTTRRFGGSGLGLTICRQLVELMDGEIGVDSTPGQGSEFWFTLPLQLLDEDNFSSPEMARIEAIVAANEEVELRAVSDIARGLGWQVTGMRSGASVMALLAQSTEGKAPDVIVLDWKMQDMDGLATARAIRERLPADCCPVIVMASAYALSSLKLQPGAECVDAFLNKPVTASALYNATADARRKRAEASGHAPELRTPPEQGLEGVRILIVDDSEINCEVAQRILREQGATTHAAVDGLQAIDWLQQHPDEVDLVLMDVQMPVMDGIEATRRLRTMPQFNDLPIVALTAGVFTDQQELARSAGMNHFISKPFDVPTTVTLIQRLKRPSRNGGVPPAAKQTANPEAHNGTGKAPAEPPMPLAEHVDAEVIDVVKGLRVWSDTASYRTYLQRFALSYGDTITHMNASLASGERKRAAALAHKLAGVAANMALPETHRTAAETERVLLSGHDFTPVLARLEHALARVVAAIEHFAPAGCATPADSNNAASANRHTSLDTLLPEILSALDADDPGPVEPLLTKLEETLPPEDLEMLRACVHDFDFRGAEDHVHALAAAHGIELNVQEG